MIFHKISGTLDRKPLFKSAGNISNEVVSKETFAPKGDCEAYRAVREDALPISCRTGNASKPASCLFVSDNHDHSGFTSQSAWSSLCALADLGRLVNAR